MPDNFSAILPDVAARAVATQRDFHRFPELGMIEFRTASIVVERLSRPPASPLPRSRQ
jgi:metal-dependent amidase/aminoacylase/carboxypeptidase family protein